ncbi:MAG: type III-B CRISPR module RAMP protein Cmr4 [Leptolyngbyaceae cyanobacterium]
MMSNLVYLYLLSPLHTGGTTQEGNLLGIARESHTDLPYIPSSTIRGRLRAETPDDKRALLWGNTIDDVTGGTDENLKQGALWIGDGSVLWLPVPSLSHGVVWISCPMLLQRWKRLQGETVNVPEYSTNLKNGKPVYLKDAILKDEILKEWNEWQKFIPSSDATASVKRVLVLPDQHCATVIQMGLWRQVKVKLDEHKTVDGGFRYEEAIPPDTVMYFPWGITSQANGDGNQSSTDFQSILTSQSVLQIGGQESLGRGFVQLSMANQAKAENSKQEATV